MENQGSLEILAQVAAEQGFCTKQQKLSESCQRLCRKRMRSFVKECVEIALLDADLKRQEKIVCDEQMPLVRKRMRICNWPPLRGGEANQTK